MGEELCNKTKKECGYLNFTNDVLDLMKKHNIKDVLTLETTLKDYELMKQTKFIIADKKISDDYLEKLKNQRMFINDLTQCEIKFLYDEETQKKLKAIDFIKEFAPLITINIKGKEYDIKANNTSDIALYAEVYINDRLIYATMNKDKIEKLGLLKEILK